MAPRLKSLELHGYKTFASRTMFEFPGVITAVVGPNGSGKSNIADAIRWVLGEQSYTLLRGRKTEDMIFAGSDQRPRAGMASAEITFDNSDGWLPIDFSEVSIARRAYRDGSNEYLLNGQRVRLKEISELLSQSGLAERTYTMIGQGLVDAALSLKPEERRRFFEEAAGIGLYRGRREEALNRLETTRRNLERVYDILSELEPRLQSLEKQARKVQEYERIKADLRLLLRDWYGFHWHRTQRELNRAREVLKVQDAQLEQARQKLAEVENEQADLRARLQAVRSDLNTWHIQSADLHKEYEKCSRNLAVMDERRRSLLDQQQSLKSDLARLEEEHKVRVEKLQSLVEERDRLTAELKDAQVQAGEARKKLLARQAEREEAEKTLRETRKTLVASETRQVQQKAHLNELNSRRDNLQRNLETLTKTLAADEDVLRVAREKQVSTQQQRAEADEDIKIADEDLAILRKELSGLESQRKKLQDERVHLEADRSRIKAQLEVLEQAEKSFSGLNQGAKFLLQASRQGKLSGSLSALSSQLIVPVEFEVAVGAVLGEYLDGVVLGEHEDAEPVLKLLEQGEKGRAVILPVSHLRGEGLVDAHTEAIGVAADLVSSPEALKPLVKLLLGQVVVVKDRSAARKLVAQLPPQGRVVTLAGEIFWGNGVVVAGQDGRSGVIARPRQRQELQANLDDISGKVNRTQEEITRGEKELAGRRKAEDDLMQAARQATQRLNQVNQAFQQASLAYEQARQKHEFQIRQKTGAEGQLKQALNEIQTVSAEMEKTSARIVEINQQIHEQSRAISRLPLDELQTQVVHWDTSAAVAGRAVKDAEHRYDEYQQTITANLNQQGSVRQRLAASDNALGQLEQEKNSMREQESSLSAEIQTLQVKIEPAEKDVADLEKENERIQGNATVAQQSVTVADRHATQAQLEVSRLRDSLDSLRRRIEEDFGLVAFEYASNVSGPNPLPLDGVEQLPVVTEIPAEIEENINRQRSQLRRMGAINLEAQKEYEDVHERFEYLTDQVEDLKKADADLRQIIIELDELMKIEFRKTFDAVASEFKQLFPRMFGGGTAHLVMTDDENPNETGIDIIARLPGRREQGLSLLSGGERSLTAVALIFALLKVSPTPFCVMDEVDAALDEANVGRFRDLLKELSAKTQFIVVTHNRNTVQAADVIYGVTMGRDSASQVISLRLDEISEEMVHS